jgi:hypothetical protein
VEQERKHEGASVTCEDNGLIKKLSEKLLECEDDRESLENDLKTWTDSLKELSEVEDAFEPDEKNKLNRKTILDIGTDCVKPLYIALKFKPDKIVGINEELSYSYTSDIEQKSKLFAETKIRFYNCSFFDKETLNRILKKEKMDKGFNFILLSKTLHHFRTEECIADKRNKKHKKKGKCPEDEKCCIYKFNPQEVFKDLLRYGERVIVYEFYDSTIEDDDKVRGRGGYFTCNEWNEIFKYLSEKKYKVKFVRPQKFQLDEKTLNNVDSILKQVDTICFYVEKKI